MTEIARLAPPNSIVFVEDVSGGEVPDLVEGSRIAASDSCVIVGTLCEIDGETDCCLGARGDVDPGIPPTFQGRLKTPSRKIAIRAVPQDIISDGIILAMPVSHAETTIYIWTNHPTEPDQVIVGVE
jgi:hypothetical protein